MRRTLVSVGVLIISLSVAATQEAAGQSSEAPPYTTKQLPAATDASVSTDELQDIQTVATNEKIPMSEAIQFYGWQEEFSHAVTRVQETFPRSYADAGIRADGAPWISFKGMAPRNLSRVLGPLPVTVEIREGIPWSEEEIVAAGQAIHYAALSEPGVATAHTDIDTSTGKIVVSVEPEASVGMQSSTLASESVLDDPAVERQMASLPPGVSVEIVTESSLLDGEDTVYGGGSLGSCTAGFSVRNSTHPNGLLTADHCNDVLWYENRDLLIYRNRLSSSKGDAQWHSSSETASPYFYYASGKLRAFWAPANPVAGQSLCKYGITSKNTCDTVYKLNQCRGSYCNLAMMHRRKAAAGDSGGPWFWGNTGYGIHSGYKYYNLYYRDMFTLVRAATVGMGIVTKAT